MSDRVCVITGAGRGNGAAFARRFVDAGYRVAMLARSADALGELEKEISGASGYPLDVTDADAVAETFQRIRSDLGHPTLLIHNAGSGLFGSFTDSDASSLEQAWRVNTLGLFLCAKQVVPRMLERREGTILVSGATSALRGGANFAAFAQAKAAQRSLAQSMARQLGPEGIHVAYVVIDGVIDIPRTRKMMPNQPDEFFLKPDAIAETFFHLAVQDRSAWTFEVDVRPFGEKW